MDKIWYKNAFQYDAYRPLVNCMLQSASGGLAGPRGGVGGLPGPGGLPGLERICLVRGGGVCFQRGLPGSGGFCSWGVSAWSKGVSTWLGGGCLPGLGGGCLPGLGVGGYPSMH